MQYFCNIQTPTSELKGYKIRVKKSASNLLGKVGNKGTATAVRRRVETLGYGTSFCIDLSITCSTGLQLKWKWVYIKAKLEINSIKTNKRCDYTSVSDVYLSHAWFCWKLISQKQLLWDHFVGIKVLCVSQFWKAPPRSIWDSSLAGKIPTSNLTLLSDSIFWRDHCPLFQILIFQLSKADESVASY